MDTEEPTVAEKPPHKPAEHPTFAPPIVRTLPPITREGIRAFADATHSLYFVASPPTLPTIFRSTEFLWLDILKVDLHHLLHTEQEYEYLEPLREGDVPVVSTRVSEHRERRGLLFVELESDVRVHNKRILVARSSFVVRKGESA